MKSGDFQAIMHPERFQDARAAHKVWNNEIISGDREVTVDTAYVVDQHCYETGINYQYWHIVERYDSEKDAEKGHNKWIRWLKDNPTTTIPDTLTDDY